MLIDLSDDEITGLGEILMYFADHIKLVEEWTQQNSPKADAIVDLANLQMRIEEQEDLENGDIEYLHYSERIH